MSLQTALWLIPLAVIFYGVVCWAIGWQMRGHADEVLPESPVSRQADALAKWHDNQAEIDRQVAKRVKAING